MIDKATLTELYASVSERKNKRKANKGKVFIRNEHGLVTEIITKMGDYDLGKHEGNVGSMKRSRKGRTYHAPNGKRFYVDNHYEAPTVVAYKLK